MQPPLTHIERVLQSEFDKASKNVDLGSSPQRIPLTEQSRILQTDMREILAGRTEIYDDREPRPR